MNSNHEGYIYCFSSEQLKPDIFKIGLTINLKSRLSSLSNTHVNGTILFTIPPCLDETKNFCSETNYPLEKTDFISVKEKAIFKTLEKFRISLKQELFQCDIDEVKKAFSLVGSLSLNELVTLIDPLSKAGEGSLPENPKDNSQENISKYNFKCNYCQVSLSSKGNLCKHLKICKLAIFAKESETTQQQLQNEIQDLKTSYQNEIQDIKTSYQNEIQDLKTSSQNEIQDLKNSQQNEIQDLKHQMLIEKNTFKLEIQALKESHSKEREKMLKDQIRILESRSSTVINNVNKTNKSQIKQILTNVNSVKNDEIYNHKGNMLTDYENKQYSILINWFSVTLDSSTGFFLFVSGVRGFAKYLTSVYRCYWIFAEDQVKFRSIFQSKWKPIPLTIFRKVLSSLLNQDTIKMISLNFSIFDGPIVVDNQALNRSSCLESIEDTIYSLSDPNSQDYEKIYDIILCKE